MMVAREQNTLFDETLEFLASTPTPEQIIAFRPSDALQERVRLLLDRQKNESLTAEENDELDEFARMNHFMSMLKIKAHKKLAA
jgi:hypothetical protein